jgi:hypothetical protein
MKTLLFLNLLDIKSFIKSVSEVDLVVLVIYALSIICTAIGVYFVLLATKTKKGVMKEHIANMAMLNDWDRAIAYANSGDERDILIALDILWALDDPRMYLEIKPLVELLAKHNNQNISLRSQKILERQVASLSKFPSTG